MVSHAAAGGAVELNPELPGGWCSLGIAKGSAGDLEGATECLRRAIELDPKLAVAHGGLGGVLGSQGRWREAAKEFEEAARLDPGSAEYRRASQYARSHR